MNIRFFMLRISAAALLGVAPWLESSWAQAPAAATRGDETRPGADRPGRGRDGDRGGGRQSRSEAVLRLSDEELVRLIPERSGFYFVGCPNCSGGTQEQQLDWTPERPDEVFCRYCKMQFPNETYPENRIVRVKNPLGEVQEYPCWESPLPPPRSGWAKLGDPESLQRYRYFFRAKAWFLAREYYAKAADELSLLYSRTGDQAQAHKAAVILDRFAQVYPGYCVHYDVPFTPKHIFPGDQKHPFPVSDYRAAKWSWWAYMDIPENLIRAYGRIRDSGEFDEAMKRRIEDDFFRASVAFVRGYPPTYGNMDPTLLGGMITAGKVLNEPDYVHEAVARIDGLVERQFYADGMWREGTLSYHRQTLNGLTQLASHLKGYSDPAGYKNPKDGQRFESFELADRFPILEKARTIPDRLRYPDGRPVVIHDTWWTDATRRPSTSTGPSLLPAYGHARLGMGEGADQVQVHLHFSGGYGHQHQDLLSLSLFARGAERLSDIGYTHTRYRGWAESTLSHNTVMVDGREQDPGSTRKPNDGNLLLYVPGDDAFQAVEASAPRAYPGLVQDYRRMVLLVGVAPGRSYVVDLFHVAGGSKHEYTLVGDADHDGSLTLDLPRSRLGDTLLPKDVKFRLPTGEGVAGSAEGHNIAYAFVRDVWKTQTSGPSWTARFESEAPTQGSLRIHSLMEPSTEVLQARGPSIRRAGSDDSLLDRITMPMLIERRQGQGLSSTFVTVIEPTASGPHLKSVERLAPDEGRPGDMVLKVAWEGGADTWLIAATPEGSSIRLGDLQMQGRLGFVRERNGAVDRMSLVGGARLSQGTRRLAGDGMIRGAVSGVLRKAKGAAVDGLVVDGGLPDADRVKGLTVVVKDPQGFTYGHEIAGIAEHEGKKVLVLTDDPAFEIDDQGRSRLVFFPGRSWSGVNQFEIASLTSTKND